MNILIVDDEPISRTKLKLLLSSYGRCQEAITGEQAIEMFIESFNQGEPYDLITLDINMPGMSGQEVAEKIRKFEAGIETPSLVNVKIMMVTGENDSDVVMASIIQGCNGYLLKPFGKDTLEKALVRMGIIL